MAVHADSAELPENTLSPAWKPKEGHPRNPRDFKTPLYGMDEVG